MSSPLGHILSISSVSTLSDLAPFPCILLYIHIFSPLSYFPFLLFYFLRYLLLFYPFLYYFVFFFSSSPFSPFPKSSFYSLCFLFNFLLVSLVSHIVCLYLTFCSSFLILFPILHFPIFPTLCISVFFFIYLIKFPIISNCLLSSFAITCHLIFIFILLQ